MCGGDAGRVAQCVAGVEKSGERSRRFPRRRRFGNEREAEAVKKNAGGLNGAGCGKSARAGLGDGLVKVRLFVAFEKQVRGIGAGG